MSINKLYIILIFQFLLNSGCNGQQTYSHKHPIPFQPESYVCLTTIDSITIDGKATEESWAKASWTKDFVDIEGVLKPLPNLKTNVKMVWDEQALYIYAKLEEPHIWAKLKQRDTVIFYDDDFEIFIDPDGDSHNYYEIEVNALNTVWDLLLLKPYRVNEPPNVLLNWNLTDMRTAVHIEGSLNNPNDTDQYWAVEFAIPWSILQELAYRGQKPKEGDQWRLNFSRVDWDMNNTNYQKLKDPKTKKNYPEHNWVWSPTGKINMHMPETWGYLQFSKEKVGSKVNFHVNQDEQIKWGLWNLHWQMQNYYKDNQKYTDDLQLFSIPKLEVCSWNPKIFFTPNHFEITNLSCDGENHWIIENDGKIYLK